MAEGYLLSTKASYSFEIIFFPEKKPAAYAWLLSLHSFVPVNSKRLFTIVSPFWQHFKGQ